MRTLTPLATWSSTTVRGESAASAPISKPRFMGPGCRIAQSVGSVRARASVSPQRRAYSRAVGKNA
jgi:hypothetical protein